jgi:hypothetical protein
VAFDGIPKDPATLTAKLAPAAMVLPELKMPLHWAAGPVRPDGFFGLVSQIRTGGSEL